MKKKVVPVLVIGILFLGGVVYFARCSDRLIEVNVMTGSVRSKKRYAYVFENEWEVHPSWLAESAARQGISTDDGWRLLSVVSERLVSKSYRCGSAPASDTMRGIHPEILDLTTTAEIDRFAREFVTANEAKRAQMISIAGALKPNLVRGGLL